jgi:ABC-type branched-subunit amino acid transport system ATPase component
MSPTDAILAIDGVEKNFGGLRAVNDVSFGVDDCAITSLIGPNGAGKTTVFNLLSGFIPPDAGTVRFRGEAIHGLPPYAIALRGIARTFQDPRIYAEMTALENVMVGIRQRGERPIWALLRGGRVNAELRAARERAEAMLEAVGLIHRAQEFARDLSFGEQRFLSIARSLVGDPRLILMDEPTVGLDRTSFAKLLDLMNVLVEREHKALFVIEHNMDVVMSVSAMVILMVQGTVVASGLPAEIRQNRSMVEAYLGTGHAARSV